MLHFSHGKAVVRARWVPKVLPLALVPLCQSITSAAAPDGRRGTERWKEGEQDEGDGEMEPMPFPKLGQAEGRAMPYPALSTTASPLPAQGNRGADGGQEAPAAGQGSSARGAPAPAATHPSSSPQNSPAHPGLCTSPHHGTSGLFLGYEHARFPLEAKAKSRSTQKAKFLPRNIPEMSGTPLPAAPASSRTHFPLFILKIFLR